MSRFTSVCLLLTISLSASTSSIFAQSRSTLDARFPSNHQYVVAIWFKKSDKAGTFKSAIMDPSIPGNYDRRSWENSKLAWNDPNNDGAMRIFTVQTSSNSRMTERQQVQARIEQERKRIEFVEPAIVDIEPLRRENSSGGGGTRYDESAPNLKGTNWSATVTTSGRVVDIGVLSFGESGDMKLGTSSYKFTQDGNKISFEHGSGVMYTGSIRGGTMEGTARNVKLGGNAWSWSAKRQ